MTALDSFFMWYVIWSIVFALVYAAYRMLVWVLDKAWPCDEPGPIYLGPALFRPNYYAALAEEAS